VSKSPTVEAIIRGTWELVSSGQLSGIAYVVPRFFPLHFFCFMFWFSSPQLLDLSLFFSVFVSSVPFRYLPHPLSLLELPTNVLRALVASGLEVEITEIPQEWIREGLACTKRTRRRDGRRKTVRCI
jgi:hypothetical protein